MKFEFRGREFAHWNVLESIAAQRKVHHYLEVGVRYGDSLKVVLETQFPDRITLCDTWGGESGGESFGGPTHIEIMLQEMKYSGVVEFLNGNSHVLLKTLPVNAYDLILIDGDHTDEGAKEDLYDCWPLLTVGGLLVFDDLAHPSHPGLRKVFQDFVDVVKAEAVYENLDMPMGVGVVCRTI